MLPRSEETESSSFSETSTKNILETSEKGFVTFSGVIEIGNIRLKWLKDSLA